MQVSLAEAIFSFYKKKKTCMPEIVKTRVGLSE